MRFQVSYNEKLYSISGDGTRQPQEHRGNASVPRMYCAATPTAGRGVETRRAMRPVAAARPKQRRTPRGA